jgi:hypothetical protein
MGKKFTHPSFHLICDERELFPSLNSERGGLKICETDF